MTPEIERMLSAVEADLLSRLAGDAPAGCIVEVGSYQGGSAIVLAEGTSRGHGLPVYAIEPHEEYVGVLGARFGPEDRAAFYSAMLQTGAYQSVRLVNLPSHVAAHGWERPVSLLFIDGDHTYEGCRRDFNSWWSHLTPAAVIAFDDTNIEGPRRVLDEALTAGLVEQIDVAGKIIAVRRVKPPSRFLYAMRKLRADRSRSVTTPAM